MKHERGYDKKYYQFEAPQVCIKHVKTHKCQEAQQR